MATYLLLGFFHLGPAAGTLIGDLLGLRVGTQVLSNDGTVVLHVEEERGEGALGSVRVRGSALALLLPIRVRIRARARGASTRAIESAGNATGEVAQVKQRNGIPAQDSVGMVDVSFLHGGDRFGQLREAGNDLGGC